MLLPWMVTARVAWNLVGSFGSTRRPVSILDTVPPRSPRLSANLTTTPLSVLASPYAFAARTALELLDFRIDARFFSNCLHWSAVPRQVYIPVGSVNRSGLLKTKAYLFQLCGLPTLALPISGSGEVNRPC